MLSSVRWYINDNINEKVNIGYSATAVEFPSNIENYLSELWRTKISISANCYGAVHLMAVDAKLHTCLTTLTCRRRRRQLELFSEDIRFSRLLAKRKWFCFPTLTNQKNIDTHKNITIFLFFLCLIKQIKALQWIDTVISIISVYNERKMN